VVALQRFPEAPPQSTYRKTPISRELRFCYRVLTVVQRQLDPTAFPMREQTERWMELCAQVATEQDPSKVLALVKEINQLLLQKERRLGVFPSGPDRTNTDT
jgi:hypothetical protein